MLTTTYDTMGRPVSMTEAAFGTWATAQYDYAGRMTNLSYLSGPTTCYTDVSESRTYNVNGRLATLGASYYPACASAVAGTVQYAYSATQNNGQITQAVDGFSGETIGYQYDALKRLTSAGSTPTSGSTPTAWTQTYQYDGFGNLTAKVLNGTTTPISVNATTNQLTNAYYDANGNMTSGAGANFTYDEANRNITAAPISGGEEYYGYDAANKRVYQAQLAGAELVTFYGAKGEKLGVYAVNTDSGTCASSYYPGTCTWSFIPQTTNIWFAGKLIMDSNNGIVQDRLGTNRVSGARFRPFGDEITLTSNDREKFATYTRDSYTGLDYADQRFYASSYGRFNTPDPYVAGGAAKGSVSNPKDPGSWNRYAYAEGDPVNEYDPTGQYIEGPCTTWGDLSWACSPFNGLGPVNPGTPGFGTMYYCMLYGNCQVSQPQGGGAANLTPQQQGYINCVANVWSAEQTVQQDIQTIVEGATTVNDVLGLAANLVVSGSVAYTAATAAVVTGVAATLPQAVAVGAAAGVLSYIAGKVAGVPEDFLVAAFQKLANYVVPKILNYGANQQANQCAKQYPVGQ